MNAVEYAGWRLHLIRYPPAESVLASIWFMLAQFLGGKDRKVDPADMGFWLESPRQRAKRVEDVETAARRAHIAAVAQAYREANG